MRDMSKLFGLPESLFGAIKEVQKEENEYQQKVRAHMQKKGIKSLGELTPEQKKTFFKEVDALHQAKNEEVEIKEESGSGTVIAKASAQKKRAEISQKIADAKTKHDRELDSLRKQKSSVSEESEQVDEQGRIVKGKGYDNPENERKAPEGKLDLTSLMPGYNEKAARFFGVQAKGRLVKGKAQSAPQKEEVELDEGKSGTGYELYHKDFSSAMAHAYDFAKQKYGIEIDPMEIDRNVAMGPKKPSSGKANAYRLLDKTGKKAIQVQVTNLDNKRYELNMYKEEVEGVAEGSEDIQEISDKTLRSYFSKAVDDLSKRNIKKNTGHGDEKNDKKIADRKRGLSRASGKIADKMDEENNIPEYKTGGEPLAKKFEKSMAKMGVSAKVKMRTVNNISVNEAAIEKVRKAVKKMKEEAPSSKEGSMKAGEKLSGKKEPIEINPEISEK